MFRMKDIKRLLFPVLAVIIVSGVWALAENGDSYIQLTRISMIEGNVGYQRVPDEDWAAVSANMPLEPGDRIYTGRDGRVEIEFEEGSVLRLSENTDIEILTLDEDYVQIRMLLGIASITVENNLAFEIASPAAAFNTERDGIYRFEVTEDGRSEAIARKGRLEAAGSRFTREIRDGGLIRAYLDSAAPTVADYNRRDAWDEWTDRRDADRRPSVATRRYIPNNVSIGVSELDRHGRWVYVSNYGWGWVPYSVASSWSPYSVGRWVYRPRFGWTWVSYEAWGWLPYHYGRWYRDARFGWTWFPGESVAFRFWSPGLVVFYRGSGWVSWGPLGPGDYYDVSYYRYRRIYVNDLTRVRLLAVRQPGNYINRNARGAFQTVNLDHFRGVNHGGHNSNARRNDITQPWKQGSLIRGGLDVSPARESYRPAPDRRGERPRMETSRPVVVRRTPPQASGNNGRFTQATNPRAPSAPDRANVDRRDDNRAGSSTGRRPDENRQGSSNAAGGNSSDRRDGQPASKQRDRSDTATPSARQNRPDLPSRDSSGENRGRSAVSKPPALQETKQPERSNGDGAGSSARENSRPAERENSSSSRDRQTGPAPAQRERSEPAVPPARQNNQNTSSRDSSGENRGRSAVSRPPASQETKQPERSNGDGAGSSARENSRPAERENSSSNRDRQTGPAPAQRERSEPAVPPARQNNQNTSSRDSSGENRGRSAVSRPPASQETRQPERSGAGGSNSLSRENSGSILRGSPSDSRNRQAAPTSVQRDRSGSSAAPPVRQNNQGSPSRSGQQNGASPSRNRRN